MGIRHRRRERDGGEDEVLADVWVGEWDAVSDREGVDLRQFGQGRSAELQQRDAFSEDVVRG